jgi:uncharacterized repeat protein (TIGR01451 family)
MVIPFPSSRVRCGLRAGLMAIAVTAAVAVAPAATAAQIPADLVVDVTTAPSEVGPTGGYVDLAIDVRNAGGSDAEDTTVKITLPSGVSFGDYTTSWQCDLAKVKCKYGTVAPGTSAETLHIALTLPPGSHGDTASIRAAASTSSRESSTANNADQATIRYVVLADLAFEMIPELTDISSLGGNGARAFIHARATNVGTKDAADVRLTFQPPNGAELEVDNFDSDRLDCDMSGAVWVCTGGPVAVGEFAFLNIPLRFPAGTTGDVLTMSGAASTTNEERTLDNNSDQASFRYVTPAPADLTLSGLAVNPYQVRAGDTVDITVQLENIGGSPAENVAVRVSLPETAQPVSAHPDNPAWSCVVVTDSDSGQRFWECTRASFDTGEIPNMLQFAATVGAGTPDGVLTFTASATTSSPEQSVDNNTVQGSTTYIAEGTVRGTVWHDIDRDGQREAGEPHAEFEVGQIVFPLEGTEPTWDTPRAYVNNFDGTYFLRLKPGRYVVQVYLHASANVDFTVPDAGDDATDSDIITSTPSAFGPIGRSAVIEVTDGGSIVIDVGMVSTNQP